MILFSLALACDSPGLVQPLVEVRAAELAEDAAVGVRLGLASGSVAAWLCAYDLQDLTELAQVDTGGATPELDAPVGVADNLAITEAGVYLFNRETGVAQVSFSGSLDGTRSVVLEAEVVVPTRSFGISLRDPEDGDWTATATAEVEDCTAGPKVSAELDLDEGDVGQRVVLPAPDDDLVEWSTGALLPRSGTLQWTEGTGTQRRTWVSGDAEDVVSYDWPGTGEAADWEEAIAVSFGRPAP